MPKGGLPSLQRWLSETQSQANQKEEEEEEGSSCQNHPSSTGQGSGALSYCTISLSLSAWAIEISYEDSKQAATTEEERRHLGVMDMNGGRRERNKHPENPLPICSAGKQIEQCRFLANHLVS